MQLNRTSRFWPRFFWDIKGRLNHFSDSKLYNLPRYTYCFGNGSYVSLFFPFQFSNLCGFLPTYRPLGKICASQIGNHFPQIGMNIKEYLKPPPSFWMKHPKASEGRPPWFSPHSPAPKSAILQVPSCVLPSSAPQHQSNNFGPPTLSGTKTSVVYIDYGFQIGKYMKLHQVTWVCLISGSSLITS